MPISIPRTDRPGSSSLSGAISKAGSQKTTIKITTVTKVTGSLTVPENVHLEFAAEGSLLVSAGAVLQIEGTLSAGLWQIFDGMGSVRLCNAKVPAIFPHWFGARGSYVPGSDRGTGQDDAPAFQRTLNAISDGQTLHIPAGVYKICSQLTTQPRVSILGEGRASILWGELLDPNAALLHLGPEGDASAGAHGCLLRDLTILGLEFPGTYALKAKSMCLTRLENIYVGGAYQYMLHVARVSEGIEGPEGGGIEQCQINLINAHYDFHFGLKVTCPNAVNGVYNRGWSNLVKYDLQLQGLPGNGITLEGSFGASNNCTIEGTLQGLRGQAIEVRTGVRPTLMNLHLEANEADIKLVGTIRATIGPNVVGEVKLEGCHSTLVQQHCGGLFIDANCRNTLLLNGSDGDNSALNNQSLTTVTLGDNPVAVNSGTCYLAGFSPVGHTNLLLNGDMERWLEGAGAMQLWGFGGWYVATRCGEGLQDGTRTRNSRYCARFQELPNYGSVAQSALFGGSRLPESMIGQTLVVSAKLRVLQGAAYVHVLNQGDSSWSYGTEAYSRSIPVENGFRLYTCAYVISRQMAEEGVAFRISFPAENGIPAIVYVSELMVTLGTSAPREFMRPPRGSGGVELLAGMLVSTDSAPPTGGDPVFGGAAQVGDLCYNSRPIEEGTAGSRYTVLGWRCVAAGIPGTWVAMRMPTGG